MAPWDFFARTIVEDTEAEESADELRKQFPRFDEAYEALKWVLSRSCDKMESKHRDVNGEIYYLHRRAGDTVAKTPDITIVFTFDDDEVILVGVTAEFDGV